MHSHRSTASNVFCSHGVSGIVGLICTGLFAQASVAANDAFTEIDGGWFDQSKLDVMLVLYLSDTLYRLDPARLSGCLDLCWFWLDLCDIVHLTRHHRSHPGTFIFSWLCHLADADDFLQYCSIRSSEDAEIIGKLFTVPCFRSLIVSQFSGIDEEECGEFAYDFVHAHRDIEVDGWNIHDCELRCRYYIEVC